MKLRSKPQKFRGSAHETHETPENTSDGEEPDLPEMNALFGDQENRLISSIRSDFHVFSVFRGQPRLNDPG
jgi:hypothetical protein